MSISTHVLDTSKGRPAGHVAVRLEMEDRDGWRLVAEGRTDADGRAGWQVGEQAVYRLHFGTGEYLGRRAFYPTVTVTFRIGDPDEHYHVPLLISPYGYSTYRGS